jgi:hypothetical protein
MISGVCERDIDLLLLEEFQADSGFMDWFVGKLLGTGNGLVACVEMNGKTSIFSIVSTHHRCRIPREQQTRLTFGRRISHA